MENVQLANTYDPSKNYGTDFWYASPKFDGVRAIFIPEKGFFTRNNKRLTGFFDMEDALQQISDYKHISFFDGEFIIPGKTFQATQGIILASEHLEKSNVEFHVFAIGSFDRDFYNTQEMLNAIPDIPDLKIFRVNSEVISNNFEAVEKICEKFTNQGYEGVMLRNPKIPYFDGRSDFLLKYKFFKEADLEITAVNENSMTVEGVFDNKKIKSNISSGLSNEDREFLPEKKFLIGKLLSVKFQSLTDKPDKNGFFSLRFPSVIGLKEDRDFFTEAINLQPRNKFPTPSNVTYRKNGFVETVIQVSFAENYKKINSSELSEAKMIDWKNQLYNCQNLDDGIKLIYALKLTMPQIKFFADYLGISLSGCKYIKAETIKFLVNSVLEKNQNIGGINMTSEIQVFKFEKNRIRAIEKNDNLWFVARDVCNVLKFFNVAKTLKSLNKNDLTSIFLRSGEQKRKMTLVNENGLFALIFQSKQPEAKRFFKWVCGA